MRNNRPECMECMKGFRLHIPKVVFHAGEQLKGCCKDRSSCKTRLRNNVIRFKKWPQKIFLYKQYLSCNSQSKGLGAHKGVSQALPKRVIMSHAWRSLYCFLQLNRFSCMKGLPSRRNKAKVFMHCMKELHAAIFTKINLRHGLHA